MITSNQSNAIELKKLYLFIKFENKIILKFQTTMNFNFAFKLKTKIIFNIFVITC